MTLVEILADKSTKPKIKTEVISAMLLKKEITANELMETGAKAKDPIKATCIEAIEFATKQRPEFGSLNILEFVTNTLLDKAPRIKWESAKVIGNIAHQHPDKLDHAIKNLLENTGHTGTVVRWSAAFALSEIIKLKTKHNKDLIPFAEDMCIREEKNSIRKFYLDTIKKSTNK